VTFSSFPLWRQLQPQQQQQVLHHERPGEQLVQQQPQGFQPQELVQQGEQQAELLVQWECLCQTP
jgi:hypothetical protein